MIEATRSKPFLGICIGLQMLFERGEEGDTPGLGPACRAACRGFPAAGDMDGLKIPHMGWNEVRQARPHPLWAGIADGARFYFVHSYYPQPADGAMTAATCTTASPLPARLRGITSSPCSSTRKKAKPPACGCSPTSSTGGRSFLS